MEIRARVTHNFETSKALAHITAFKKYDPEKRFCYMLISRVFLLFLDLALLGFWLHIEFTRGIEFKWEALLIAIAVWELYSIVSSILIYFYFPKAQYKSLGKMENLVDEYIFSEESFTDTVKSEGYNEKTEIGYSMIYQVMETSRYFFIYRNKTQVYIVDKTTLEGGTAEDLRGKFMPYLEDKYIICNY